jgi:hypothetical protein
MPGMDREMCRKAAAECVELARVTTDPVKKEALLQRAQQWIKTAYSHNDAEFEKLLGQLNSDQMAKPAQRTQADQQQAQQQQSKINPKADD